MSELKYQLMLNKDMSWVPCYIKSEADKVIADLEESHKKEVGQLLIEIAKLKQQIEVLQKEKKIIQDLYIGERNDCRIWASRAIHNKYKRCLAMAEMCDARHDDEDTKVNGHGASWEYKSKEMKYCERWHNRWLSIAEKFKE